MNTKALVLWAVAIAESSAGEMRLRRKLVGVHVKYTLSLSDMNGNTNNWREFCFLIPQYQFLCNCVLELVHPQRGAGALPVCGRPKCP